MRRSLSGQLDYIRDQAARLTTLVEEAARLADSQPRSRWVHGELRSIQRDVDAIGTEVRSLRDRVIAEGLGAHAAAAPPIPAKPPIREVLVDRLEQQSEAAE